MLEYIAESVPGPALMPEAAYDRYRARAWGQFLGLSLGSTTSALGCARHLAPELARRDAAALRAQIERIEPLERRSAWLAVIDGSVRRGRACGAAPAAVAADRTPRIRAGEGAVARGTGLFDRGYRRLRARRSAARSRARGRERQRGRHVSWTGSAASRRAPRCAPRARARAAAARSRRSCPAWSRPAGADSR